MEPGWYPLGLCLGCEAILPPTKAPERAAIWCNWLPVNSHFSAQMGPFQPKWSADNQRLQGPSRWIGARGGLLTKLGIPGLEELC